MLDRGYPHIIGLSIVDLLDVIVSVTMSKWCILITPYFKKDILGHPPPVLTKNENNIILEQAQCIKI